MCIPLRSMSAPKEISRSRQQTPPGPTSDRSNDTQSKRRRKNRSMACRNVQPIFIFSTKQQERAPVQESLVRAIPYLELQQCGEEYRGQKQEERKAELSESSVALFTVVYAFVRLPATKPTRARSGSSGLSSDLVHRHPFLDFPSRRPAHHSRHIAQISHPFIIVLSYFSALDIPHILSLSLPTLTFTRHNN